MGWSTDLNRLTVPVVRVSCSISPLNPFIRGLTIQRTFGGRSTFQLSCYEYGGSPGDSDSPSLGDTLAYVGLMPKTEINPFPSYGSSGKIRPHNMTRDRALSFTFEVAGMSWTSHPFLGGDVSFDGYVMQWQGEDLTGLLEVENQSMPDIIATATPPTVAYAHATMKAIGTAYNVNVEPKFPDYRIRQLRRQQGRPLDWLDMIARPYQALRFWDGNKLVFKAAEVPPESKFDFRDELNIEIAGTTLSLNVGNMKNKFTIGRGEPQAGIIGETECIGGQCIGRTLNVTFDNAAMAIVPAVDVLRGVFENWVYFDEADNPIGNNPYIDGIFLGAKPAKRVEATYKPSLADTTPGSPVPGQGAVGTGAAWTPRYQVTFFAGPRSSPGLDTAFAYTVQDAATIAQFGLRPEYSNIEDDIIPNAAVAQAYANAMLRENVRKVWKLELETPYLNPYICPGMGVTVYDFLTAQSGTVWFVEDVSLSVSEGNRPSMSLSLTKGL